MVVFTNGASDRAEYRKFKVSEKNDDTGNIYQTIFRRLSERHIKGWGRPDLLLIDGGKGQLAAAIRARDERGVAVPIVSIAKREEEVIVHKTKSCVDLSYIQQLQRILNQNVAIFEDGDVYIVNLHSGQRNAGLHSKNLRAADDSLVMSAQAQVSNSDNINTLFASTDIIKLFQRIRDESHRFAVSYHSTLKRKNATKSILDDIHGIGPKTKRKLLRHFGSLGNIKKASIEDISKITNDSLAKKIKNSLRDA